MAKQEKLLFDYEEYFNEMLKDIAIMMFSTRHPGYQFVFYLNALYNIQLERLKNITLNNKSGDINATLYHHKDNVSHQTFMLLDIGHDMSGRLKNTIFDKTLLVFGADAISMAGNIYDDLETSATQGIDQEHELLRQSFIDKGLIEYALFDFSDPDNPETTYFKNSRPSPDLLKKQQKFLKEQRTFICDLLLNLDDLLPDYEEE